MMPDFELDSYGRKVFPVKSYLIREDLAVRVDLKTTEALAAEHNAPHFVIRDVNGDGGSKEIVKRVWSLHFTHIPSAGLVIAYVPPSREEGEAATKLAGMALELRSPPSENSVASLHSSSPAACKQLRPRVLNGGLSMACGLRESDPAHKDHWCRDCHYFHTHQIQPECNDCIQTKTGCNFKPRGVRA